MTRTLRGAWSRRGTLLPLLVLTVVVVAGAVTVIGFAQSAGTSPMLAVPLLLLGAVAVPATGRELASARRGEIAMSRLRGLRGAELYTLLAVEPLLVLVLGGIAGTVLGAAGSWLASRLWVDADAALPGLSALLAGAAIVVVGLGAVLVGMAGALREPLSEQVSIAARPRAAATAAVFANVLVIVAAVVAVYRSGVVGQDPDLLVLAGPALVGLAIGQVVVWLIRLAARAAVGRTTHGSLAGFLAVRRLARVADAATPLRILVAACVVAALSVTAATQVNTWTDDTARLRTGAPLQISLADTDAVGALALTRRLDPDGRWLMAGAVTDDRPEAALRTAWLDLGRWDRVAGAYLAGTPASVGDVGALTDAEPVEVVTGD
ncbi:MAG: FtsX-like permease family protein, partial [Nocardioides sp.]|nr:FtsX-like permease family protein [Nocardioides sp.]